MTTVRSLAIAATLLLPAAAPAQELNWAEKMFDTRNIDFGVIARGADASVLVKITNLYQQQVHISDVKTTCGCSAASPSTNTLSSRETAYVEVTMDTRRFTRRKDSNLIVTFDAPLYAEVRIPITAYIRTDVVLEPGSANFGAVDIGAGAQRKIDIAYAGRDDWKIRQVISDSKYVSASVVEKARGGGKVGYDLHVTLDPAAPIGQLREQIYLVTDDANGTKVPVLVEARVEADITVTPDVLALGDLKPGETRTANVVLRGKQPFEIEKIECDSDRGAFKVRLPKSAKPVHVLPLTFTCPEMAGDFTEVFTVTIAGRPQPLTFKAYGRVNAGDTALSN